MSTVAPTTARRREEDSQANALAAGKAEAEEAVGATAATSAKSSARVAASDPPASEVDPAASAAMPATRASTSTDTPADDPRPAELITISHKRASLVTDSEIEQMLFEGASTPTVAAAEGDDAAAAAQAQPQQQPARVASLAVQLNRWSLLPASVSKLRELTSLSLQSAAMQLVGDDDDDDQHMHSPPPPAQLAPTTGEGEDGAPSAGSLTAETDASASTALKAPSLARKTSGLRALHSLRSLELVHQSPPPLTSGVLPDSLEHLSIRNFPISDTHFFSAQLANLRTLSLSHCRSLKQLPDSVHLLQKLEKLSITQCPRLSTFPKSLLSLPALSDLNLSSNGLYLLPEFSAKQLPALQSLNVQHNRILVLPRVFRALKERGCQLLYDEQLHEQLEAEIASERATNTTVSIEEIREESPAPLALAAVPEAEGAATAATSPVAAAASAPSSSGEAPAVARAGPLTPPSHKPKRKLQHDATDEAADEADQPHAKHARSASSGAAAAAGSSAAAGSAPSSSCEGEPADAVASSASSAAGVGDASAAAAQSTSTPEPTPTPRTRPAVPKRRLADTGAVDVLLADEEAHKRQREDPAAAASFRYFLMGELSYSDRITSGFFDPGRHSALFASAQSAADMSLQRALDSKFVDFADQREIVLVDFERDVRLRQIQRQARLMLKQQQQQQSQSSSQVRPLAAGTRSIDELQLQVKLLACLVSDSFGGRVVVFSPQQAALGRDSSDADLLHHATASGAAAAAAASSSSPTSASAAVLSPTSLPPSFLSPLSSLSALCHAETSWWRRATNSNCVLLASIQHGLCRHRSLLMKILCDELFAPGDVRCKVVRGFREGGAGHAWTVVNFRGRDEVIVDTLDSPMLFRPLSSLADPSFSYFPQFSESSDSAFAAAHGTHDDGVTNGGGAQQLAFKDLYRATRGRLIGAGAYAEVFECRLPSDAGTSYPLALKVTPTAHLSQAHFSSLLKEIRLLPHLRHPNIVSFLGWLITPRTLNLFLELVVGQNLDITLKTLRSVGQKLRVEDVIVIALEVAKGLRYLHAHATLHRDLKSAQVLIGHPALTEPAPGDKPFSMQLHLNKKAHPERTMFKPKHKFAAPAGAAAAAAASASSSAASSSAVLSSAAGSSILPSPQPGELSFFSSAAIKICDFNIAAACIDPPEESDVDAPHQPVLEYVGTLRWCAPEVYRASAAHTTLGALSSGLPAAAAAAASSGASSSSGASFAPASAAQRLAAGRAGDVWSYANVLLELLTLHLPFEDVPTEPMLNEMLRRGQRSSYQQWLDEAQWKGVTKLSAKTVEEQALRAWKLATAAATAAAPREGGAASSSHTAAGATAAAAAAGSSASSSSTALRLSIYQSLVGLHLQGTMHAPEQRPSMDEIVDALSHMHAQLKEDIVGEANPTSSSLVPRTTLPSVAAAAAPAAAAAAAPVAAPAAPSRLSSKHARDRSSSPTAPARSSRARIEEPQPVPATRI